MLFTPTVGFQKIHVCHGRNIKPTLIACSTEISVVSPVCVLGSWSSAWASQIVAFVAQTSSAFPPEVDLTTGLWLTQCIWTAIPAPVEVGEDFPGYGRHRVKGRVVSRPTAAWDGWSLLGEPRGSLGDPSIPGHA